MTDMEKGWEVIASIEYEDKEPSQYEIAVIKKSNRFGHQSAGWGGKDKIILFSEQGNNLGTIQDVKWAKKVAETISNALNKAKL